MSFHLGHGSHGSSYGVGVHYDSKNTSVGFHIGSSTGYHSAYQRKYHGVHYKTHYPSSHYHKHRHYPYSTYYKYRHHRYYPYSYSYYYPTCYTSYSYYPWSYYYSSSTYCPPVSYNKSYYTPTYTYYSPTYSSVSYSAYPVDSNASVIYGSDQPAAVTAPAEPTYSTPSTTPSANPWALLGEGKASAALNVFAIEAPQFPDAGLPKAGYAIAAGLSGDLDRAVWAMRKAFRQSPNDDYTLPNAEAILPQIKRLADQFAFQAAKPENGDPYFMAAALCYIKGDYNEAAAAIEQARKLGDHAVSTENLSRAIAAKMYAPKASDQQPQQ